LATKSRQANQFRHPLPLAHRLGQHESRVHEYGEDLNYLGITGLLCLAALTLEKF
jgi:hypothetical protein